MHLIDDLRQSWRNVLVTVVFIPTYLTETNNLLPYLESDNKVCVGMERNQCPLDACTECRQSVSLMQF